MRRRRHDHAVADDRQPERRPQVLVLHEHLGGVRSPVAVLVGQDEDPVSGRMRQRRLLRGVEVPVVHGFGHPDAAPRIDVDVRRVVEHRRFSPEGDFQIVGQGELIARGRAASTRRWSRPTRAVSRRCGAVVATCAQDIPKSVSVIATAHGSACRVVRGSSETDPRHPWQVTISDAVVGGFAYDSRPLKRKHKPRAGEHKMSRARSRVPWLVTLGLAVIGVALTILALRASWSRAVAPAHHASASSAESHRAAPSATFAATIANTAAAPGPAPAGMVWIPGGEFSMGSHVESEALCALPGVTRDALPVHRVYVDGFWMDATEVTNDDFASVREGHRLRDHRRAHADGRGVSRRAAREPRGRLGGVHATTAAVRLDDHCQWWRYQRGASWRHPEGPASTISRSRTVPGRPRWLRRRRGVRGVGGQAAADRSRVGVCGARRADAESCTPGATISVAATGAWPTPTRESSLRTTQAAMALPASRRSPRLLRTAMGSTTWPATSGSG